MVAVTTAVAPEHSAVRVLHQPSLAPVIALRSRVESGQWGKRLLDIVLSSAVLLMALPLLVVIAVLIKLDSSGPVFFCQQRVGYRGRRFGMLKFRSMVADAEDRLGEVLAMNEADGLLFKIRLDPRVTRVGRVIRKFSLDELPQLVNVLRGEMSLVGPRPLPVSLAECDDLERMRLAVRPGITGPWQTAGRSDLGYADMLSLDLAYIAACSLWTDLRILLRTIPVVLKGSGAY